MGREKFDKSIARRSDIGAKEGREEFHEDYFGIIETRFRPSAKNCDRPWIVGKEREKSGLSIGMIIQRIIAHFGTPFAHLYPVVVARLIATQYQDLSLIPV